MQKIIEHLKKNNIKHEVLEHKVVYTALDLASTLKARLNEVAKNLLVRVDQNYYMVIVPATHNLNLKKLKEFLSKKGIKARVVELPGEEIMKKALKLKKEGIAAFGSLYQIPVIIEKNVLKNKKSIFNPGEFVKSIRMSVKDFVKLEKPLIGAFGDIRKMKKQKQQKKVRNMKKPSKKVNMKKKGVKKNSKGKK